MSSIPTASIVQSKSESEEVPQVELSAVLNSLKGYSLSDLFKVLKAATAESEKKSKEELKNKGKKAPRKSSAEKGVMPPHLMKPSAWFNYVLSYARKHGWESYTVQQTRKDKTTGEKTTEEIVMPGSVLHNGEHIFKDSISEKEPNGRKFIQKDAMSLSKVWWSKGTGAHEDRYREFETQYDSGNPSPSVPEAVAAPAAAASSEKKVVNKKSKKTEL